MKLSQIRKRAAADGADEEAMEAAADGDDEKSALIKLIVQMNSPADEAASAGMTKLRAELSEMKLSQLRKRAVADGVDEEATEEAADGDDEKTALIDLLLARQPSSAPDGRNVQLRGELSGMKLSQVRKRATADGLDDEAMEEAADGDDEKTALIELILQNAPAQPARVLVGLETGPLREELQAMRTKALQKRATAAGIDDDSIEDALDAGNTKAALIAFIVDHAASRGPAERIVTTLQSGGENSTALVSGILEHAAEVLEQLAISAPRKARRSVLDTTDRMEVVIDGLDEDFSEAIRQCAVASLSGLAAHLVELEGISVDSASVSGVSSTVATLLDRLDECSMDAKTWRAKTWRSIESTRLELSGLRLTELQARTKAAGHAAELLEEAINSDEP